MEDPGPPPLPPTDPLPPVPARPSNDDTIWMVGSHLSLLIGMPFLIPFIIWLAKRDESPLVSAHAKEALNFHLSVAFYAVLCIPLVFFCVGIPLLLLLSIAPLVLAILAAIEAANGGFYRYPLCIRLIR